MSSESPYYGLFDRGEFGFDTSKMSWAHWLVGVLAAITGAIHVYCT